MATKTGPNRRYLMSKNLILMLVMAVLIVLAIMAWFTLTKSVSADQINVKAISSELDIAESVKTYDSSHNILTDGPGEFGSTVTFNGPYMFSKDCTGDGMNLYVPEFNVPNDYRSVKKTGKEVNINLSPGGAVSDISKAISKLKSDSIPLSTQGLITDERVAELAGSEIGEYQYIEKQFYVRSKRPDLLITAESQLLSQTEIGGGEIADSLSSTHAKRSAYGNFNVDGLVGAIRVALIGQGATSVGQTWQQSGVDYVLTNTHATLGTATKQLLWVPRPDVYLNVSPGDATDDWNLITGVTPTTQITVGQDSVNIGALCYKHTYYTQKKDGENNPITGTVKVDPDDDPKTKVSSASTGGHMCLGADVNVSDFNYSVQTSNLPKEKESQQDTEDYYVTKYTMRIWIEGTDAEARRAMDGGDFSLNLEFR